MNMVTMPDDPSRIYYIVTNADGQVDVIQKGTQVPHKQLPIELM